MTSRARSRNETDKIDSKFNVSGKGRGSVRLEKIISIGQDGLTRTGVTELNFLLASPEGFTRAAGLWLGKSGSDRLVL